MLILETCLCQPIWMGLACKGLLGGMKGFVVLARDLGRVWVWVRSHPLAGLQPPLRLGQRQLDRWTEVPWLVEWAGLLLKRLGNGVGLRQGWDLPVGLG